MSEKLYTFASEIRTTATQLETLKSKIARHIGLVWSLHLHQRYPAARRDMTTPTPQHPYHHHVAASVCTFIQLLGKPHVSLIGYYTVSLVGFLGLVSLFLAGVIWHDDKKYK